jgi:hypothetical protein
MNPDTDPRNAKSPGAVPGLGLDRLSQSVAMTPASPGVVVDELNSIMQGKVQDESDMRHPVSHGSDIAGSNAVDITERRLLRSQLCPAPRRPDSSHRK